jgi:predicted MFS family arabinose efflux permease
MLIIAGSMVMMADMHANSGYGQFVRAMLVMALGMGLTATPMTNLIMSSVPREHAGVGSAMNDTTRELGTTLGVAILGSVLSSAYVDHLPSQISQLPAQAAEAVRDSIGGALYISNQIGGEAGRQLAGTATEAWMTGTHSAFLVGAGIAAFAAVFSFVFLSRNDAGAPVEIEQLGEESSQAMTMAGSAH